MAQYQKVILESSHAKNVDGTSCDNGRNWKDTYERYTNRSFGTCSFYGCGKDAEVGGHLRVKELNPNYHYIAPICKSCNGVRNEHYYNDMKQNIAYLRIPINSCVLNS